MIKKIIISAVVISMLFTCTACPSDNETEDSSTPTSQSEVTISQTETESETTTEATQTTATPTPKPTATPTPMSTPTPEPTEAPTTTTTSTTASTEATTTTAAPTPTPEPTATPTPEPEPEPTEDSLDELRAEQYSAGMSYVQDAGYTITNTNSAKYAFTFVNTTGTYRGIVSADLNNGHMAWRVSYEPVDSSDSGATYSYYGYSDDLVSLLGEIDSSWMSYGA